MTSTVCDSAAAYTLRITSLSASEVQLGLEVEVEVVSPIAPESPHLPLMEGHLGARPLGHAAAHLWPG